MRNQVQLIAYADRLGGSIAGLDRLLAGPLAGLIGGVHVLPCYASTDHSVASLCTRALDRVLAGGALRR